MDRTIIDGFEVSLRSPEQFAFEGICPLEETVLVSISQQLDKKSQSIPHFRAPLLRDALNTLAAVAARRAQPLYIAPNLDQLTDLVPTVAASSPVLSLGPLPSAMIKGGLLVIPDISYGVPDHNLLSLLMGNRHIDLPELGLDLEAESSFRVVYCSAISLGDEHPPNMLEGFLSDPIDIPEPGPAKKKQSLEDHFPDSPKNLIDDIVKLIGRAKELGHTVSARESERFAKSLLAPTKKLNTTILADSTRSLFGDDIARLVEKQKLLTQFHELENTDLLAALKEELETEDSG
jgi:hypothetical protein